MLNFKQLNIAFIILISIFVLLIGLGSLQWWSVLFIICSYITIIFLGVTQIQRNFFLDSISRLNDKKRVLLTFDDGPHPEYTPQILDILDHYQIKAIFFVIGKNAEKYPDLLMEIRRRGHTIGNHSYSHESLFDLFSTKKMIADVEQANTVIANIVSEKPKLFRPPFGITNPRIKRLVKHIGHTSVAWSFRSYDTSNQRDQQIFNRLQQQIVGGDIILFHDNLKRTPSLLKLVLPWLSTNYNLKENTL